MSEPRPISLSDEQLTMILHAAAPLQRVDRDPFLRALAERLRDHQGVGDGELHRVLAELQQQYFKAPVGEELRAPAAGARRANRG